MSGGCVRRGPRRASEVSGVWRCCRAPLSRPVAATVPAWEAFPEVNRVLVSRLLALLIERMARAAGTGVSAVSAAARLPWERAEGKVQPWHRDRLAVVYVRQSTA